MISLLLALQLAGSGAFAGGGGINAYPMNTPTISSVTESPSATTIVLGWTTSIGSDSRGHCATEEAVDDGIQSGVTTHQIIVAGLTPSTQYTCTVVSGSSSSTISATTTAAATSTPITGLSYGSWTQFNSTSPPNQFNGDTYVNCISNDGALYMVTDDVYAGFSGAQSSAVALAKVTGESPFRATNINSLSGYGACCSTATPDQLSPKAQGIWCQNGNIYLAFQRTNEGGNYQQQYAGSLIESTDHGLHWNNWQNPAGSFANGQEMVPQGTQFTQGGNTPTNGATNTFVMYGADDGTNGYMVGNNRFDNGDAYAYLVSAANTGGGSSYDNDDAYYLMRVPRAKMSRFNASDYQWYTGSGGDGSLDAAWSYSQSSAAAILSASQSLSVAGVQYIPALNRYLLLTFYFPSGGLSNTNSVQVGYEAPHPWGPWTLINSTASPTLGWYNQYVLMDTALAAIFGSTTMTVLSSQNFRNASTYTLYYTTLTVTH